MTTATLNGKVRRYTGDPSLGEILSTAATAIRDNFPVRQMEVLAASGASSATGSDGGFFLGHEHSDELLREVQTESDLMPLVRRIPVGARISKVDAPDVDKSDHTRTVAARVKEGETLVTNNMLLNLKSLEMDKLGFAMSTTNELLEDAAALEFHSRIGVRESMSMALDREIVAGTGTQGQSLGLINGPGTVVVGKEVGQGGAAVLSDNLRKMSASLLPSSFKRAVWLMHPSVLPEAMAAEDFTGPDAGAQFGRLLTRPVIVTGACNALGTVGDIALVDLSQYLLFEAPFIVSFSEHYGFASYESALKFTWRVMGQPRYSSPITLEDGS